MFGVMIQQDDKPRLHHFTIKSKLGGSKKPFVITGSVQKVAVCLSAASVTSVIYRGKKLPLCWHKAFLHSENSPIEERTMNTMSRGKIELRWFSMVRFNVTLIHLIHWCFTSSAIQSFFFILKFVSKQTCICSLYVYMYPHLSLRNIPKKISQNSCSTWLFCFSRWILAAFSPNPMQTKRPLRRSKAWQVLWCGIWEPMYGLFVAVMGWSIGWSLDVHDFNQCN